MKKIEPGFAIKIQCDECPWRRDVPVGRFAPSRYRALAATCKQGWPPGPIFACHKTPEGKEQACVGFLLLNGRNNIGVRIAASQHRFNPGELRAVGPLYDGFREMCVANGFDPGDDADFA
jgi:hypothetical protein